MLRYLFAGLVAAALPQSSHAREVHSYASQIKDVDAVNSHWFETEHGVILVDAQRILPEAERALLHLQATTEKPVIAIFITHPHTDHYGGLPVWTAAYPDAHIYMTAITRRSIREDSKGYNAARARRHGDRFASQAALDAALDNAVTVSDGQMLEIDESTLELREFGPSEAESTLAISLPGEDQVFIGDLINVGVPAVPFESLDRWLEQLGEIEAEYGRAQLYQGHGPAPVDISEAALQRAFLTSLRELVADRVADGTLSESERQEIVFALEAKWPFYTGVAGNTRREMLDFDVMTVAGQIGVDVAPANAE